VVIPGIDSPLPALCVAVVGAGPDFLGSTFAVFDADGSVKIRTRVISTATWQGSGSPAGVAYWSYADLSS
jgi:hypothetical protein